MKEINRRNFIKANGIALMGMPIALTSFRSARDSEIVNKRVQFTRDGLDHDPHEYSKLLSEITDRENIVDNYSRFGVVEELENKFAEMLGKESAVFMPTGTLANHIAIRKLAGNRKKVIVQEISHIYRDSGDCCQKLSGLNLIPLAPGKTGFTLNQVEEAVYKAETGRVKSETGAISIESPVRRKDNEMFDFIEMEKISHFARSKGIGMHLDGARLFNAVAHSGITAKKISGLFDTVYVSMYKDFCSASGAILAGDRKFTEELYHTRRMFGGGMPQVWPFAAVALYYADSFLSDYHRSMVLFDKLEDGLNRIDEFRVERISNGTNVFKFYVDNKDLNLFKKRLSTQNIDIPDPVDNNHFNMKINNTLLRVDIMTTLNAFRSALI